MKLVNETRYDTRVLRALLTQVHNREAKIRGRLRTWAHVLTIRIVYERRGFYTGRASYDGSRCLLRIPRGSFEAVSFAAIWRHELWHLYGIGHRDYTEAAMACATSWVEGWVEPATFSEIVKTTVKPSLDERRAAKTISLAERLARWESKKRRAERAIAKIQKSLRYYEQAAGKISTTSSVP